MNTRINHHDPVVAAILGADLGFVRAFVVDHHGTDENYAVILEKEWKKYLVMLHLNPGVKFPMAQDVDEFAHAHIAHTREYGDFCSKVMGGMVHHTPTYSEEERTELLPLYLSTTIPTFEAMFGEADSTIWVRNRCVCTYDIDDNSE